MVRIVSDTSTLYSTTQALEAELRRHQVDDIYFVPTKKSEKTLVVESVAEKYNVQVTPKSKVRDADEYNRRSGFTNDPEAYIEENYDSGSSVDEYQDYDYSTRIIRFRSPSRAFSSSSEQSTLTFWALRQFRTNIPMKDVAFTWNRSPPTRSLWGCLDARLTKSCTSRKDRN